MKSLFLSLFASSMIAGGAFAQSVPISQLPTTSSPNAAAQIPASVGTYPSEITFKYTPPQIVSAGATAIIPSPPTPGHCAQFTTTGTIGDSGAGCAGGGLTVPVAIAYGGTGATTQAGAQAALGALAAANPTFTGTLSGPLLNFNGTNAVANLGGSQAMYIGGNLNGSVFVGVSAGNGYTALYNTGVGTQVLGSITTGGEDTGLGTTACALLTVAVFDTCLGQHALGYETSASSATAVGNTVLVFVFLR